MAAWRPTSSSVPKLSQAPVATSATETADEFPGFTQDAIERRDWAPSDAAAPRSAGEPSTSADGDGADGAPKRARLSRFSGIPPQQIMIAAAATLVVVILGIFSGRAISHGGGASLRQIRQSPKSFDGRQVVIAGEAGRVYLVAGRYVFDLYQGRDTIVVCSSSSRPMLHEKVRVGGTVSVGYVDGEPRLALLEAPPAPSAPTKP